MRRASCFVFVGLFVMPVLLGGGCTSEPWNLERPKECTNNTLDSGESDVDCGSKECNPCKAGKLCNEDKNCDSGLVCVADPTSSAKKRCVATHCTDKKLGDGEADVDCGGECLSCTAGQICKRDNDCQSTVCVQGICQQATCSDGRLNQDEPDVDCGSQLTACSRCAAGKRCTADENCESKLCTSGSCKAPTCSDARQNGDEGGVDCGGSCPTACNQGSACSKDGDCTSGVCRANNCLAAECGDGVRNGNESDVDCGGLCAPCLQNAGCNLDTDCVTGYCNAHICQRATCDDKIRNQGETDIDCGDPRLFCQRCIVNQICTEGSQCASGSCVAGRCADLSCADGIKNGSEGDIDCGGDCSKRCADGAICRQMSDCESRVCGTDGRCAVAACGDGAKNGFETDKDCGGDCPTRCEVGQGCNLNSDCRINSCAAGTCSDPLCTNGTKDGTESDQDCGGNRCTPCLDGQACATNSDCISTNCVGNKCAAASCADTIRNGLESDVDCGGSCEKKCPDGAACGRDLDCASGKCASGKCQTATCSDGVQNGKESDADCGGAACVKLGLLCELKEHCLIDDDCRTKVCNSTKGVCEAPSCQDSRPNQDETDVDCGGKTCGATCKMGQRCAASSDCADGRCQDNHCAEPSCTDGVRNGLEGGVDCGAACNKPCPTNSPCKNDADCEELVCGTLSSAALRCLTATCSDGKRNGQELDVDCGFDACGASKCLPGQRCGSDRDCNTTKYPSMKCVGAACVPAGCGDKVQNGSETDVDCGGGSCPACKVDQRCRANSDCETIASGRCSSELRCAAAACDDQVKNGPETGIDCGGDKSTTFPTQCKRCPAQQPCTKDSDCDNVRCLNERCQQPTCADGLKNGSEADMDCGGACSAAGGKRCDDGRACGADADCVSGWCSPTTHLCTTRTCSDGQKNGAEGDVDCGIICSDTAKLCATKLGCNEDGDCASGYCSECTKKCIDTPVRCLNPFKSGGYCPVCETGQACSKDTDCRSLNCASGQCAAPDTCPGKILEAAKTNSKVCQPLSEAGLTAVGPNQSICFAYLRCMFQNNCTPFDPCYTNAGNVCHQNQSWAGGGDVPQVPLLAAWNGPICK